MSDNLIPDGEYTLTCNGKPIGFAKDVIFEGRDDCSNIGYFKTGLECSVNFKLSRWNAFKLRRMLKKIARNKRKKDNE